MKAGDMVRIPLQDTRTNSARVGLVVEIIQKKCWRTGFNGKNINWDLISPESHAVVMFPWNDGTVSIPVIDLEVVDEAK